MITSPPLVDPMHPRSFTNRGASAPARGFTLSEVIVATGISALLLGAILSTFVFMARSGVNLVHYNEMEAQARQSLQIFAQDVRSARDIVWNDTERASGGYSITLTLPGITSNSDEFFVTYYFDPSTTGPTARAFCRKTGGADSTATPAILVSNISRFALERYKTGVSSARPIEERRAVNNLETKQLQLTLTAARERATVATSTHIVLSARFVLRNKPYSQVAADA